MCKAKTASGQVKRLNDIKVEQLHIQEELKRLEYDFPENEELQNYIKLLNRIADLDDEVNSVKEMLTESMPNEGAKVIESGNIVVTYVAPTIIRKVNLDRFTKDYGPETEMYKKYVDENIKKDYVRVTEIYDRSNTKKSKSKRKVEG